MISEQSSDSELRCLGTFKVRYLNVGMEFHPNHLAKSELGMENTSVNYDSILEHQLVKPISGEVYWRKASEQFILDWSIPPTTNSVFGRGETLSSAYSSFVENLVETVERREEVGDNRFNGKVERPTLDLTDLPQLI